MTLGKDISGKCQIIEVTFLEVTTEAITLEEVEVGLGIDNIQVILEGIDRSSNSRSRSGSRASTNRDRIRCFKCREYDHFAKDCPNSQTEKEPEQIQQMYNLDKDQTAINILAADTYDSLIRTNSEDAIDHLNL